MVGHDFKMLISEMLLARYGFPAPLHDVGSVVVAVPSGKLLGWFYLNYPRAIEVNCPTQILHATV